MFVYWQADSVTNGQLVNAISDAKEVARRRDQQIYNKKYHTATTPIFSLCFVHFKGTFSVGGIKIRSHMCQFVCIPGDKTHSNSSTRGVARLLQHTHTKWSYDLWRVTGKKALGPEINNLLNGRPHRWHGVAYATTGRRHHPPDSSQKM